MAAKADAFLASCGKDPLEIYRIEKFEPVPVAQKHWGKFYDGDAYVVLHQSDKDYDIHYWDGENATTDEIGCAAAFSVELSDVLKLPSRHHLELQREETDKFLSYFSKGIQYLPGGVESGFKHVEPDVYPLRLLCIEGERYPRVYEVPCKNDSFTEGDVYILDNGMELYYWSGTGANMHEKTKGMEVIAGIKNDDRQSKPCIYYPRDVGGELED